MTDLRGMLPELRIAVRSLLRTPGFTAATILILALGIGGSTAVFSVVNQVLLKPLPYAEPGQLVRIYQTRTGNPELSSYVSRPAFDAYREMRSFEDVAGSFTYTELGADVQTAGGAERVRVLQVSAAYFDVLRARPVIGRGFLPDEELTPGLRTAVISEAARQRYYDGAGDVVGRTLVLNAEPYEIVGVAPAGFEDPVAGAVDVWLPHALIWSSGESQNHFLTVVARLNRGTTLARAAAELQHIDAALAVEYPEAADRPGRLAGLHEDMVRGTSRMLYLLLGAVGLLLLIVCVNIANLLIARAIGREREFAVRAALGSGRGRIVHQLLLESLLLAVAGAAGGVLLASLLLDGIIAFGSDSVPRLAGTAFDVRVLGFTAAVSIGCALLFGLLPAVRFSAVPAGAVLRGSSRSVTADRGRNRLRSSLVGAQVAVAFVLLVSASILMLSFHRLQSVDLGIDPDGVLTFEVHLPTARYDSVRRAAFHEEFAERVGALAGVRSAGAVSRLPATGSYHSWGANPVTGPLAGVEDSWVAAQHRVVSANYFAVLDIRLLEGRLFDARDAAQVARRVVISRSAAQSAFPDASAVGQTLHVLGRPVEVIGVVADVALTPEGEVAPSIYHAHRQFAGNRNWPLVQVVRTDADPSSLIPSIRAELRTLDPELVLHRPQTLAGVLGRGIAQRQFTTWLMTCFAGLALLLASLGLFGVITYMVRQRRREIGIRGALGAQPAQIRTMVLEQGLRVALTGVAVGLAGSLAASRALRAVVFDTNPADLRVLVAAAVAMLGVAALAAWLPAREATAIDPATVMQSE